MGCPFCVSGRFGFHGNLTPGEIINQILSIPSADKITHIVFMGMGEPLDNINNVLKSQEIITAQWGLSISSRNVTLSTVGINDAVERYLNESNCNLTFSLFSPFHDERIKVIPAEKKHPAEKIIGLMKGKLVRKGRRLTVAYVMIDGVNDSDSHLAELIRLLRDSKIRINLLPYHPVPGDPLLSSSQERMQHFKHNLIISGISASVRRSRGEDISAACGLLAAGTWNQI
jgi:23S rRNA (adenine2503-C2)-methyltransferase